MAVTLDEFRAALRRFGSGVTIVAAEHDGRRQGMTVSAFTSVSATPPLVQVCLRRGTRTHGCVEASRRFAVSLLRDDQRAISERFSGVSGNQADRFEGLPFRRSPGGAPILSDALGLLECAVQAALEVGDHTIFVGLVEASGSKPGSPLLYFDGHYRKIGGEAGI